jgi:hypothetical protein
MKRSIFIFFVFMAVVSLTSMAQQKFSIRNTEPADYPKIVVGIDIPDQPDAQQTDFKVLENGKEVQFSFSNDATGIGSGAKAICFLIEASGFTYGSPLENFKKAVAEAIGGINENDKVNICYFSKVNADGNALNTLSAEFTSDKNVLVNEMKSRVKAVKEDSPKADVFKSIYECLSFINEKKDLPQNKILIVISAAINNGRSSIKSDECIANANRFKIPVYTITYKTGNRFADNLNAVSDMTNAKRATAQNSAEITKAISDYINQSGKGAAASSNSYTIEFTTTQSGDYNTFEVQYKDEKQAGSFNVPPDKISFWKKFMIWIIVFVALFIVVIVFIVWFILNGKKKKAAESQRLKELQEKNILLQQQMNQSRDAKTQTPAVEQQKFDLKRTQIGGGGGTPTLMVSAGSFSKNFPLNKPQISIGRNAGNDVVIPDQTVSGEHARLVNENGNWFIVDNKSTNGTFVNGTKVSKQRVTASDMIKLGAAFLKIQL